jgi:hypothetical protein
MAMHDDASNPDGDAWIHAVESCRAEAVRRQQRDD